MQPARSRRTRQMRQPWRRRLSGAGSRAGVRPDWKTESGAESRDQTNVASSTQAALLPAPHAPDACCVFSQVAWVPSGWLQAESALTRSASSVSRARRTPSCGPATVTRTPPSSLSSNSSNAPSAWTRAARQRGRRWSGRADGVQGASLASLRANGSSSCGCPPAVGLQTPHRTAVAAPSLSPARV